MGPVEVVFLAIPVVIVLFLLAGLRRTTRGEEADGWAERHGITLTGNTRKVVEHYLQRSRKFKLTGALLGIVLPLGTGLPGIEMIGGYLVGALAAELRHPRLAQGSGASASLLPRTLREGYLPDFVVPTLRTAIPVAALLGAAYLWGPRRTSGPDLETGFGVGLAAALLAPLAIEALLRKVVNRPQPSGDPHLIAVDDAMRSTSVHAIGGAGVAIVLILVAGLSWGVGMTSDINAVRWALPIAGVAAIFTGLAVWWKLGAEADWRVRRGTGALGTAS